MSPRTFAIPLLYFLSFSFASPGMAQLDDHLTTINSPADLTTIRNALIQFIWGQAVFPAASCHLL